MRTCHWKDGCFPLNSHDPEHVAEVKRRLRRELRARREALSMAEREAASAGLCAVLRHAPLPAVGLIGAYAALGGELDTGAALTLLQSLGWVIAYPRVDGNELVFHRTEPGQLVRGYQGIREPVADHATHVEPSALRALLVPAVAFDRSGNRLGHGGGFYDRLLGVLPPGVLTIGVAYDFQVLEHLPTEPHDVAVQAIATPTEWIPCRKPH